MHPKSPMWLAQIEDATAFVLESTANATVDAYQSDRRLRQAVERSFQIMVEAMLRLKRADPETVERLPGYRAVVALRKGLFYGYDELDNGRVWEIIQNVVPNVHKVAARLLREAEMDVKTGPSRIVVEHQAVAWDVKKASRTSCRDNPVIAKHLGAIRALCREYGVRRLEVFGSACTPEFDPERSDVDFLVEYPDDYDFGPWLTRYFVLKERLETLLGRSVDLVMVGAPRNKYFIKSMNETRELLYAA